MLWLELRFSFVFVGGGRGGFGGGVRGFIVFFFLFKEGRIGWEVGGKGVG